MVDIKFLLKIMALGCIVAFVVMFFHIKSIKKDNVNFPSLKTSDAVNDIIIRSKEYRGVSYIETETNNKFRIENSKNYFYNPIRLCEFIQEGDSISKQRNVDTIIIFRDDKEYYFLLGKIIGKE
ncbi:hypothetical protein [Carboxylicivirga taeanensis]|uniref:hypothetical protein n=1 Tax=Carboxylicivirga taeanensis TaxID=1416875 RepID=UPI003F6E3836